jgi:hypothetical protein
MRDVPVELLGVLFPGVIYLSAGLTILLPPAWALLNVIERRSGEDWFIDQQIESLFRYHEWSILIILLLTAYVMGHAFFRQDPKEVDRLSVLRIWRKLYTTVRLYQQIARLKHLQEEKNLSKWERIEKRLHNLLTLLPHGGDISKRITALSAQLYQLRAQVIGSDTTTNDPTQKRLFSGIDSPARLSPEELDVQYPYVYLKQFLNHRGLVELAKMVNWDGIDRGEVATRSKSFINNLKIRLFYYVPQRCGLVVRNEGHIRLMASVWFVCRSLAALVLVGMTMCVVRLLVIGTTGPHYMELCHVWWWSLSLTAVVAAAFFGCSPTGAQFLAGFGRQRPRRSMEVLTFVTLAVLTGILTFQTGPPSPDVRFATSGALAWTQIAVLGGIWGGTLWLRRGIEKSLHYMRIREIVFVMETAHTAAQHYPEVLFPTSYKQIKKVAGSNLNKGESESFGGLPISDSTPKAQS